MANSVYKTRQNEFPFNSNINCDNQQLECTKIVKTQREQNEREQTPLTWRVKSC
jgi:hypothetical protein